MAPQTAPLQKQPRFMFRGQQSAETLATRSVRLARPKTNHQELESPYTHRANKDDSVLRIRRNQASVGTLNRDLDSTRCQIRANADQTPRSGGAWICTLSGGVP